MARGVSTVGVKASKGSVKVEEVDGRLRLRWRVAGERYTLALGLQANTEHQAVAEAKAKLIERDILLENFDSTLERYRPAYEKPRQSTKKNLTALELFKKFADTKRFQNYERSMERYEILIRFLTKYGKDIKTTEDARNFRAWYSELTGCGSGTLKERIWQLASCYNWALEQGLVSENIFKGLDKEIRIEPKQPPKPFTTAEIARILLVLERDDRLSHYKPYILFLLNTGCRISEAIGLRWKHLSHDCSSAWIGESLSRKIRKGTKTNKTRNIPIVPKLQKLLTEIMPKEVEGDALVFKSPRGKPIDDHNFANRTWREILSLAKVDHRKPYNLRHTFISHCLAQRMEPVEIAKMAGHDIEVMFEHYVGSIASRDNVPTLF